MFDHHKWFLSLREKNTFSKAWMIVLNAFCVLMTASNGSWIRRWCWQTLSQMSGQIQARPLLLQKVQLLHLGILVGEAPRLNMDAWGLSPTSSLLLNVGAHSTVDSILASCLVTWVRFSAFSNFFNAKFSQNFQRNIGCWRDLSTAHRWERDCPMKSLIVDQTHLVNPIS